MLLFILNYSDFVFRINFGIIELPKKGENLLGGVQSAKDFTGVAPSF